MLDQATKVYKVALQPSSVETYLTSLLQSLQHQCSLCLRPISNKHLEKNSTRENAVVLRKLMNSDNCVKWKSMLQSIATAGDIHIHYSDNHSDHHRIQKLWGSSIKIWEYICLCASTEKTLFTIKTQISHWLQGKEWSC